MKYLVEKYRDKHVLRHVHGIEDVMNMICLEAVFMKAG